MLEIVNINAHKNSSIPASNLSTIKISQPLEMAPIHHHDAHVLCSGQHTAFKPVKSNTKTNKWSKLVLNK